MRAVHLEMAYGLDTDLFLNAFYRMANRRCLPREMLSDNGGNFVKANKELRQLVEVLDQDRIRTLTANQGVTRHFNPPAAPHFGGLDESMNKAASYQRVWWPIGIITTFFYSCHSFFISCQNFVLFRCQTFSIK